MTQVSSVDWAILGGGCAGLSLAHYLSQDRSWSKKTLVIESRASYDNDRSWCFWRPQDPSISKNLAPLISRQWSRWRFSGQNFSASHEDAQRPYCYISSADFYRQALASIRQHPNLSISQGLAVTSVHPFQDRYCIRLSDGSEIHATEVMDTRPQAYYSSAQSTLWQIVYGYEIETASPSFDPSQLGLMEDLKSTPMGMQLMYCLPFTEKRALVECTLFSPQLYQATVLQQPLQEYIDSHFKDIRLIRTEQAILPMGLKPNNNQNLTHYYFGGQVAGAIRPATGYGFLRIQRWARDAAQDMRHGQKVDPRVLSTWLTRTMDSIFLGVLQENIALGPALFQALAEKVPARRLARFLSDDASMGDYLSIMRAFPASVFLKQSLNLGACLALMRKG